MLAKDVTILKEIEHVVGVPVKFVHMVGNPFDMVATQVLKHLNLRWDVAHGKIKVSYICFISVAFIFLTQI